MKTYLRTFLAGTCLIWGFFHLTYSQPDQKPGSPPEYQFTVEKRIPATPVKDQHHTGTCWCFATTSFIESELLRTGQGEADLSEMFFVRKAYELKADKYVRMHGTINFERGGLAMDVMDLWKEFGMMTQEAYPGDRMGDSLPVHGELDAVLRGYVDQVIKNRNHKLTPVWKDGFNGILDAYLGTVPESFHSGGSSVTPRSFADNTGLDPEDYVAIGSFTHHPFYERFILEIPDNWNWGSIYNVPLDEMMELLEYALSNGYSACWDMDMSEKGYIWDKGVATFPGPVTQEKRQTWFDDYLTTDDHLEHITGLARDQEGNRFYLVKNSWGSGDHIYKGYHYVSVPYMRAKTLFIMVHRDAVPPALAERLSL